MNGCLTSMDEDLTECSPPLIIILLRLLILGIGVGSNRRLVSTVERRWLMKVSVYLMEEGKMAVLVEAALGKGLSPLMIRDITPENVLEKVGPAIETYRRSRVSGPRATS